MEDREDLGFQIQMLSHMINHLMHHSPVEGEETPVTRLQGRILGYLYVNRDRDVFQRDIQAQFSVRRSTVTGVLQLLEKNGYILRKPVEWDARLKKLELTPKALGIHESVIRNIRRVEEQLSSALTPQEKETFLALCQKIRTGIETQLSCRKETE